MDPNEPDDDAINDTAAGAQPDVIGSTEPVQDATSSSPDMSDNILADDESDFDENDDSWFNDVTAPGTGRIILFGQPSIPEQPEPPKN